MARRYWPDAYDRSVVGGNHYFGDTAVDLFEPFAEEFDLISNLHARQVRLTIASCAGVPAISLPDIPWGAEA